MIFCKAFTYSQVHAYNETHMHTAAAQCNLANYVHSTQQIIATLFNLSLKNTNNYNIKIFKNDF